MERSNDDVADVLDELALWQELEGAVPFKVLAYRNAAESLRDLGRPIDDLVAAGEDLTQLESIGKGMAARIEEILARGVERYREEFRASAGPGLFELLKIAGLGPKRIRTLRDELGVDSPEALRKAAEAGQLRELTGFGEKTEERLLRRVKRLLGETD